MKNEDKTKEQLVAELAEALKRNRDLENSLSHVEAAKRQWESTVDCIGDMVLFADEKGKIQRCNKAAYEFLGRDYSNILGRPWPAIFLEQRIKLDGAGKIIKNAEVLHEPSGKCFMANFYDYKDLYNSAASGHVVTLHDVTDIKMLAESLEITNSTLNKDRQELHFALEEISFLLQEVENKKDLGLRFRSLDASLSDPIYQIGKRFNSMMEMLESGHKELEKAYTELKMAQSHILQQEKMASIGQLAAGIAHEINNPTGFILSNLNSLRKYAGRYSEFIAMLNEAVVELADSGPKDVNAVFDKLEQKRKALKLDYVLEDTKQLIQESIDGAERIKRIVQDLKSFSHADDTEYKPANINEGLESTINMVWNELKYKATVRKEYGEIPMVRCNLGQLNQVFMNLLINAAQAIEKRGEITTKTWHDGDYVYVSVADTGSGIPKEKIDRIFEPFFTTKEVGKGTGLGLSIAYDIVKKHAGEIKVDSEVDKGTTFTIKIPVQGD